MPLFKKDKQPTETASKDLVKKIQALEETVEKITAELAEVKKKSKHTISKIGITRFNPFKEIGGDQSFAVALLDEEKDGIIITSYYGRDLNRMYAKEIKGGTSQYNLSQEEKEAISQAMGQKND
jgi:hypothetical protein